MRNYSVLLFLSLIVVSLSHCSKNDVRSPHPLDGSYQGFLFLETGSTHALGEHTRTDTFPISLKLEQLQFKKSGALGGICPGVVDLNEEQMQFTSGDCGCWCDCSPYVDCIGDFILDSYQYQADQDSLLLWAEFHWVDSVSNPANFINRFQKKDIRLVRE